MSRADGMCIFFGSPMYMSLGAPGLMLHPRGRGHDKSMITLLSLLSFLGLVRSGFTWHHGWKGGAENGPSMAPYLSLLIIYMTRSRGW